VDHEEAHLRPAGPEDPAWLGSMLGAESFAVMRTLLIAAIGEPLTAEELVIFTQITNRRRRLASLRKSYGSSLAGAVARRAP
jgi:hypothetical protein